MVVIVVVFCGSVCGCGSHRPQTTGQATGHKPQTTTLATGHWPQATGHRPLATGHWPEATGPKPQATGHKPLPTLKKDTLRLETRRVEIEDRDLEP